MTTKEFKVSKFVPGPDGLVPYTSSPANTAKHLAPGVYDVNFKVTQDGVKFGLVPRSETKFLLPERIYGLDRPESKARTIMEARKRQGGKMSIALIGQKGSGKTMTGQWIANELIEQKNAVCFYISTAVPESIMRILSRAAENVVLFIDEFDRRYLEKQSSTSYDQTDLLSFFSDTHGGNMTIILTSNNELNSYYVNRPNRVQFMVRHETLEPHIFEDVLEKNPMVPMAELYVRSMFQPYVYSNYSAQQHCDDNKKAGGTGGKYEYNLDSLLEIMTVFQSARSFDDAFKYLEILNVPKNRNFKWFGGDNYPVNAIADLSNDLMLHGFATANLDLESLKGATATAKVTYSGGPTFNVAVNVNLKDGSASEFEMTAPMLFDGPGRANELCGEGQAIRIDVSGFTGESKVESNCKKKAKSKAE